MKKLAGLLFLALLALYGCSFFKKEPENKRPLIVSSVAPYAWMVGQLTSPWADSITAVKANADPHLFEPRPKEVAEMAERADLFIAIGEAYEDRLIAAIKASRKNLIVLKLNETLETLSCHDPYTLTATEGHSHDHDHGHAGCNGMDRHYWLSMQTNITAITQIVEKLLLLYPEHHQEINSQAATLISGFRSVDADLKKELAPYANKSFLTSHAAFGYFCHDYKILQIAVEAEGKEALLKEMGTLLEKTQEHHPLFVVYQPQHDNRGAKIVAEKLSLPEHTLNPYAENPLATAQRLALWIEEDAATK